MAALQTLRNKPVLLMSVIGGALLLFIITMVLENQTGSFMQNTDAGEAYGEKISIQDFESRVAKETNLIEFQNKLQGNMGFTLNEDQKKQIRQMVWDQFVQVQTIKHESEELGLSVSEKDIQEALTEGKLPEVQFLMLVGQQTMGVPTIEGYKQFLTNFDKTLTEVRNQRPELEDYLLGLRNASKYCETKVEDAILVDKYSSLMKNSFTTSDLSAKMELDEASLNVSAEIVGIPYSSIADSVVKVSDEELKNKYNAVKSRFFTPCDTRHIKYIQVPVTASVSDMANLRHEVGQQEMALASAKTAEEVAVVVSNSKTVVPYGKNYFKKEDFNNEYVRNIQSIIDTMAVGHVQKTFSDGESVTTFKLVDKVNTADSLYIRQILTVNRAQADSVVKVLANGSNFGDVAKSLGQPDTAVWLQYTTYSPRSTKGDSTVYTDLSQLSVKTPSIITNQGYNIVTEVLEKKSYSDKYNVAIVKYPIEYSKETYEDALSKLNNFLANNKTVEEFDANAQKENYIVYDIPNFSSQNLSSIGQIKGEQANVAIRWAIDEAEVGDISNTFECPESGKRAILLAMAVASENTHSILPLDNEMVKSYVEALAIQDKKADQLAAELEKGTFAEALKLPNAISDSLVNFSLERVPSVSGMGYGEAKLSGALQKAEKGEMKKAIKGSAGVYRLKLENKSAMAPIYTIDLAKARLNQNKFMTTFGTTYGPYGQMPNMTPVYLLNTLKLHHGDVEDSRYQFNR